MSNPVFPTPFETGPRLIDGEVLNIALQRPITSWQDSITATPSGTQTTALQLTATTNRVSVVANAGDAVKLPKTKAGNAVIIINDTTNALQVFSYNTATINGIAGATGVSQAPGTTVIYECPVDLKWFQTGIQLSSAIGAVQSARGTAATTVTSSTTLVNVTGLTVNLVAGGQYDFEVHIPCTSGASGGTQAAMGGTATWTSINTTEYNYTAAAVAVTTGTTATPGTAIAGSTAANIAVILKGSVVCTAAGTFNAMFAQNASNATSSVALANSYMNVTRIA